MAGLIVDSTIREETGVFTVKQGCTAIGFLIGSGGPVTISGQSFPADTPVNYPQIAGRAHKTIVGDATGSSVIILEFR